MNSGRRRTDVPDALLRGAATDFPDHPTQAGRDRSERRRDSLLTPGHDPARRPAARSAAGMPSGGSAPREDARQLSKSRLPLPPVPAASRGVGPAAPAARSAGPMAPAEPFGADPLPGLPGRNADASAPPAERRSARSGPRAARLGSAGPLARVPRPASPHDDSSDAWTPADATMRGDSGRRGADRAAMTEGAAGDLLVRRAPSTTAIPERSATAGRSRPSAAGDDDQAAEGEPGPRTGRAVMRAERQAADMARRKAVKRSGGPASALPEDEDEVRKPRGIVKGLAAMAVVGLSVLGVYTWAAPVPEDAAAKSSVSRTAPDVAPLSQLPPLRAEPVAAEPTVASPVRVPVTVLNATDMNGLAGKISATVVAAGWESPGVGAYEGDDVAVSTVFFTEGDENQRQAALQLIEQFPQLSGPAPRFFELPADATVPGLVVVAAGEWVP